MVGIRRAPMSTANRSPPTVGLPRTFERVLGHAVSGVQAIAFWTAALLPFVLVAGLFSGVAGGNLSAVGGAVAVNVVCAVLGHGHSPN